MIGIARDLSGEKAIASAAHLQAKPANAAGLL